MAGSSTADWSATALGYLPRLLDRSRARSSVTILMYHAIVRRQPPVTDWCLLPVDNFVRQMEYLRAQIDVLPLREALARLSCGALSRPTAVLTFDDGFQNVHDVAFPVLRRLGLPATVFLNTGFVDTGDTIWFCRIVQALAHTERPDLRWRGDTYPLRSAKAKRAASVRLQQALKQLPQDDLLREVEVIEGRLDRPRGDPPRSDDYVRILDRSSIRRMADSGLVEFGAHTETHAILTRVGVDRARREIEASIRGTSELTGRPCDLFSYPNGTTGDFDGRTLALLRDAGVAAAVTTIPGLNSAGTPPLELRRDGIGGGHGLLTFQANVHHTRQHLPIDPARWRRALAG